MMRLAFLACALLATMVAPACADTLVVPSAVERTGPVAVIYRLDHKASGSASLALEWTDSLGRLVERRTATAMLADGTDIQITLDARRAVAMRNELHARLTLNGVPSGAADAVFIARPAQGWSDYQIFMWQEQDAARTAGLAALGINGDKIQASRSPVIDPAEFQSSIALSLGLDRRWFVENIATDFYSAYHYWTPDHPNQVNWRFLELQQNYLKNPSDPALRQRDPSLSDPAWIARIRARLAETVRLQAPYRPYYYNLGDEAGIADLAANWDFDFSPLSLAAFRTWLGGRYPSLDALNEEWGTHFAHWDDVMPSTTIEAMRRADDDFASWSDFKDFMDEAFASAVSQGTAAVHQADPTAFAAIEGGQAPGWGGYDYTRLSHAVDVMEIYDIDNNVEIARSLNPALTILSTGFESGPREQHRLWHSLLLGERGLVIWDDDGSVTAPDGGPGPQGRADAPTYRELRGGIGALLIASAPHTDDVGVLYSPASFRMRWLLQHRAEGDGWARHGSGDEDEDRKIRESLRDASAALIHAGLQPRYLTPAMIETGALRQGLRALVLPDSLALSPTEAAEIRGFRERGGLVLADGQPGSFDQHGRRLPQPLLDASVTRPIAEMARALPASGITPGFTVTAPDGQHASDVDIRVFRNGGVTILGLQRDLGPRDVPAPSGDIVLALKQAAYVHDLRAAPGTAWQRTDHLRLTLDPVAPALLAIADAPPPSLHIAAPTALQAGASGELRITGDGAASDVLHIDAIDPAGHVVPYYAGNIALRDGTAVWPLPMAVNDKPGKWILRVRDMLAGSTSDSAMELLPP